MSLLLGCKAVFCVFVWRLAARRIQWRCWRAQIQAPSSRWEAGGNSGLFFFPKTLPHRRERPLALKILLATAGEPGKMDSSVK
jgi:hypothetical protein